MKRAMEQGVFPSKAAEIDSFDSLSLSAIWHIKTHPHASKVSTHRVRLSDLFGPVEPPVAR